jgi:hypothetical protein
MTGRKVAILSVLLAGLTASATAQTPTVHWIPYSAPDKSFSVEFPEKKPIPSDTPQINNEGAPTGVVTHQERVILSRDLSFTVNFRPIARGRTAKTAAAFMSSSYDANYNVTRSEQQSVTGGELVHKWYVPKNSDRRMETVVIATDSQVISLSASRDPKLASDEIDAMIGHFFKSLTLNKAGSTEN